MILLALAAATAALPDNLDKVERCRAAVHGSLATAAEVCRPSSAPVNLWSGEGLSSSCSAALRAGADAGRMGPTVTPAMRAGLVRSFDQAWQRCQAPAPRRNLPKRDGVNLWD